ncbi:MAG: hypothetical protein AB7S26_15770 [Sandaracinaceae bacterium]
MRSLLSQDPETWDAGVDRHARRLTALGSAEAYVEALDRAGWLRGHDGPARAAVLAAVQEAWTRTPRRLYVYAALEDVAFETSEFAAEGSYARLLEELSEASRHAFAPTGIEETRSALGEDEPGATVTVSFEHGGARYVCELTQRDEWCMNEPLELVEEALTAAGVTARFLVLPTQGDGTLRAAFVDPAAFEAAVNDGLVPNAAVVM